MALAAAAVSGLAAGAIGYKVKSGKPAPERINREQVQHRPAYWRNWVGNGSFDVNEGNYKAESIEELQTSYPRQLPDGNWLPPDNESGVNPAVGTIVKHTGRTWRQQQMSAAPPPERGSKTTKANRAPMPPKQTSMITM